MKLLADALCQMGDAFEPDFLAYAALAGKIETELCASLAWRVRQASDVSEIKVVKELWQDGKKIDLAVLRGDNPCVLIEAKQWRGFNFASWSDGKGQINPVKKTREDIEKLRKQAVDCERRAEREPHCFILSLCVHCDPVPDAKYDKEVKYLRENHQFRE